MELNKKSVFTRITSSGGVIHSSGGNVETLTKLRGETLKFVLYHFHPKTLQKEKGVLLTICTSLFIVIVR